MIMEENGQMEEIYGLSIETSKIISPDAQLDWINYSLEIFQMPQLDKDGHSMDIIERVATCARNRIYCHEIIKQSITDLEKVKGDIFVSGHSDAYIENAVKILDETIASLKLTISEDSPF